MKLPSITQIWADYLRTTHRFPLTLVGAVTGTFLAIFLVEHEGPAEPTLLFGILLSAILSLPLLTALKLLSERENSLPVGQWTLQVTGVVLLAGYAFLVPAALPQAPLSHLFRFAGFGLGCCFLLSFLPFRRKGQAFGFWQFNKTIVFRTLLAIAFAVVLFVGLGLALAALRNLFGMEIPAKRYFELLILIAGFFAVPFILSGIPEDLQELNQVSDYPKSLRVFGQYVLPPLVLVYFVILYAYIAKIIVTWNWPEGWVGRLILGFSATGILSLFVLDPLRERAESHWLQKASRWYYLILFPLIVVLFLALLRRISEYGITEGRYLGFVLGIWLTFMAGYFLLSRSKNIKAIPVSLGTFAFLVSFGPWGAFLVSEQSQIRRLEEMLVADSILVNGVVQKAPSPVSYDDRIQISAILTYLHQVHGYSKIQPWFKESLLADDAGSGNWFKDPDYVAGLLGIEFDRYGKRGTEEYFSIFVNPESPISTSGYDQMVRAGFGGLGASNYLTKRPTACKVETARDSVIVTIVSDSVSYPSIMIPLRPLIDSIVAVHEKVPGQQLHSDQAMLEYETAGLRAKIIMLQAYFQRQDGIVVVNSYDALILFSRKYEE